MLELYAHLFMVGAVTGLPFEEDLSAGRRNYILNDFNGRGLSCTVWAEKPEAGAWVDHKRDIIHRYGLSILFTYMLNFYEGLHAG